MNDGHLHECSHARHIPSLSWQHLRNACEEDGPYSRFVQALRRQAELRKCHGLAVVQRQLLQVVDRVEYLPRWDVKHGSSREVLAAGQHLALMTFIMAFLLARWLAFFRSAAGSRPDNRLVDAVCRHELQRTCSLHR